MKTWMMLVVAAGMTLGMIGCEKKEPTAGQQLDKAIDSSKAAASDAAKSVQDAVKK